MNLTSRLAPRRGYPLRILPLPSGGANVPPHPPPAADVLVQPAVPLVLSAKPDRRDDRPPHRRRRLVDAISLERKEDLDSLVRGDESVAIRTPHAIFAAAGMVGPDALSPEPWALDGPHPVAEPCALLVAVRPQPCGVCLVLHLESAYRFQSHRPHPPMKR